MRKEIRKNDNEERSSVIMRARFLLKTKSFPLSVLTSQERNFHYFNGHCFMENPMKASISLLREFARILSSVERSVLFIIPVISTVVWLLYMMQNISVRLCTYSITIVSIIVQITYRGLVFGHKGEDEGFI